MYLSKLELHGFKSFADRTVLHFAPGTTAVVGPNGCGKSNIVDAVRWVIGEQRARVLRSEKMENVIFNGTARRRPLGMAEVQLTIENTRGVLPTEYTEVTIGRRLFRSGESEYLLNGAPCRLKDITDLFMDTGMGAGAYSVIELKMIDEILSENAQDQRRLFEEAAGITRYKLRRRQTLAKLDSTQADLTRLRDLTDEIGKQVRSLKRQADKAARYQEYRTRLRQLELALAQLEYDRLTRRQETLHAEIATLRQQNDTETSRLDEAETRLAALTRELGEREQALAAAQAHLQTHLDALRALEAERQLWQERMETALRERDRTRREAEQDAERRTQLEATLDRLSREISGAEPEVAAAEEALDAARATRDRLQAAADALRERLLSLRQQVQTAEDTRAERRRALDRLTSRLDVQTQERTRLQQELASLQHQAQTLDQQVAEATTRLEATRQAVATAQAALKTAEDARETRQAAVQAAADALRQAERRCDAAAAEVQLLDALVSSYDEFSDAVQFLATTAGWSDHPLRTVADVLACDEAHRLALDAALGDLAACIVVASEAEADAARQLLHRQGKGQATFLVLDQLPDAPPAPPRGDARPLASLVRVVDPACASLPAVLLHDWALVPTLDEARTLAQTVPAGRFVTPDGEWADACGLLHGGSARTAPSPAGGRLGRREQLDAARARLATWEAERSRHAEALASAQAALDAVPFEARRTALQDAERHLAEARQVHARLTYEQETLRRRQQEVQQRLDALAQTLTDAHRQIQTLEADVAAAETDLDARRAERSQADDAFQTAEAESRAAMQRFSEAHVAAVQARNRLDNLRRDRERTQQALHDLDARAHARAEHLDALAATLTDAEHHLHRLTEQIDAAGDEQATRQRAVDEAHTELQRTKKQIADIDAVLRGLRRNREQQMREENLRAVRLAEVDTRLNDLVANVREDFDLDLSATRIDLEEAFDEDRARAEVTDLRARIRALGAVNELALEAYEQEKERLDFLLEQQQDLERAEATLLETIDEINTTASERFLTTFSAIQDHFARIFAELFVDDATASLRLADPEDPLESPIDITARPRGKRPSTIAQLSGGEKTLTAIALLFAIYLVKPSPFCILDEVDAPLDDANVDRFMNLIRAFSDQTQFILVTHNKRTMEMADRLYGVTMQEQGVSKLVAVQFDEAVEMAGA
ncbi:chromosome segregation protein SMC [Rhodothermaceae bacterium RA]|nr:chromosome segregation protein SMC [Rhodothermaceae bacterium RA]